MNRMKEYQALMKELEVMPEALETAVERALTRKNTSLKKLRVLGIPMGSLAACFLGFILLVNCFPTFAYACGNIPLLRELAKAVAFSPSLSAAVENEYVQPVDQSQTVNGITATVQYVIVDQKQVNIFFTLEGDYETLQAEKVNLSPDQHCAILYGSFNEPPGTLLDITLDYMDEDVPEGFTLTLGVTTNDGPREREAPERAYEDEMLTPSEEEEPEILAEFSFDLEFDPYYTARGEVIPVNQTITLDGQTVTVTEAEVYPTHVRINVAETSENTAWLKNIEFYLENEDGKRFKPISNGITATGDEDSPANVSYRLESPYFARSKHLTLHITGAEWLDKDRESIHIDLANQTAEYLPEGVTIASTEKRDSGWILEFHVQQRREGYTHQAFYMTFLDAEGNEYDMGRRSTSTEDGGNFTEMLPLPDYTADEVWLKPCYSRVTEELVPITIPIK